jgi:hypothetical protein
MLVTDECQTLIDLARSAPARDSVTAIDFALNRRLCSHDDLLGLAERLPNAQGRTRALRAVSFASPLAQLPGESFSRVLMHELGFPPPTLQHEFPHPIAGRRFADFWWADLRLIGEFDGKSKYVDPAFTRGRAFDNVLWDEKLRENELRDHDTSIIRWTWSDLKAVHPFVARLEAAGLRRIPRKGFV